MFVVDKLWTIEIAIFLSKKFKASSLNCDESEKSIYTNNLEL